MKKSGILISMIAVFAFAGGLAVRDAWLPNVVGEKMAQKIETAPTSLMADLFDATTPPDATPAPDVKPPETPPVTPDPTEPIDIPVDRIELIVPTENVDEPTITLDELLEGNDANTDLPSSGPRKMPRPSSR